MSDTTTARALRALAEKYSGVNTVLWVDEDRGGREVRLSDLLLAEAARIDHSTSTTEEVERKAAAYRVARRRLRILHTALAGRRQDWASNTEQPCATARAVAYQSAMQSVHSIIDEIEAIPEGKR